MTTGIRVLIGLTALLWALPVQAQRTYWPTPIDTLWVGHQKHTHVAVTGKVAYVRTEDDGDTHIRLNSLGDSTKFVIAECIPLIPCTRPTAGRVITVRGISRFDPEHLWREVHPVESWALAP
jgi:hypothetical protein